MTDTDLHDRLRHLADQADQPTTRDAGIRGPDLWRRGRRYQRRRRAGTALIAAAAVVLAVVVTGVSWQQAGPLPAAAPADAPVALPDRIHEPSPWLPGTAETGPPGQLVALIETERGGWFGSRWGVVGVSATTGDYRFLDLPGAVVGDGIQGDGAFLSPDGSRVAYWLGGEPSGTPNTGWYHDTIVGVGVYDTVTGSVERHLVETEHGLSAGALAWVDGDTLLIEHGQLVAGDDGDPMEQSSARGVPVLEWDIGVGANRVVDELDPADVISWGPSVGGRVVALLDPGLLVLGKPLQDGRASLIRGGRQLNEPGALNPTGTRLAAVWGGDGKSPNRVSVGKVPDDPGDFLDHDLLPGSGSTYRVVGWVDSDHVAVERRSEPVRAGNGVAVFSVHAETGESTELVALPEGRFSGAEWATDLLGAPVVERPAPPTPLSPRLTAGLLLAALVGGVLGIVGWRRRVQP